MKKPRDLEQVVKGFSNNNRIKILITVDNNPNITVESLADILNISYKNLSKHLYKMYEAGLVTKQGTGVYVQNQLTAKGEAAVSFLAKI